MTEYQLFEFLAQNGMGAGAIGLVIGYFVLTTRQKQAAEAKAREAEQEKLEEERELQALALQTFYKKLDRVVEILEGMKAEADRKAIEEAAIEAYIEREVKRRSSTGTTKAEVKKR